MGPSGKRDDWKKKVGKPPLVKGNSQKLKYVKSQSFYTAGIDIFLYPFYAEITSNK